MSPRFTKLFAGIALLAILASTVGVSPAPAQTLFPSDRGGNALPPPADPEREPAGDEAVSIVPASAATLDEMYLPKMGQVVDEVADATGVAGYLVVLAGAPVAAYGGGLPGFAATSPATIGQGKLNVAAPASVAYARELERQQAGFLANAAQTLGRRPTVVAQFQHALNALLVELTPEEAARLAALPEVRLVQRNTVRDLLTDVGPAWMGATSIWNGSSSNGIATRGEGVLVGILDTGINTDHPSFADVGGDGYNHTNPFGAGNYKGWCNPSHPNYNPALVCNDKLVGVYSYDQFNIDPVDGPEDYDGHGSHTASTVAGNLINNAVYRGPTRTFTITQISGVAPHANIIAYDVCGAQGCAVGDSVAAVNQAVQDGVDVLNFSISGGNSPYSDAVSEAFLNARAAGMLVAASAGNSGPGESTVAHQEPWTMTVAASTHNRSFASRLTDLSGGTTPPAEISGEGPTAGYGPAPIVYAGNAPFNDPLCEQDTADNAYVIGGIPAIVVCDRGEIGRVEKGENVKARGAGGMILVNDPPNAATPNADDHVLPAIHISNAAGLPLKAWLATGSNHRGRITGGTYTINAAYGNHMASFSSRGPGSSTGDVLKPDLTAPGVGILAAVASGGTTPPPEFGLLSGTSMSSPHAAGAAVLIRALFPGWSPAEVQSALMLTARTNLTLENTTSIATPLDYGAGHIDLTRAARAGFVLDESRARYAAANPNNGGSARGLNLASLADSDCMGSCVWTRTISSTMSTPVTWNTSSSGVPGLALAVIPSSFTLAPFASRVVTITANVTGLPVTSAWAFGQVTFNPDNGSVAPAHFPVVINPSTGTLPELVSVNTRRDAGSTLVAGLETIAAPQLTIRPYGLVEAALTTQSLQGDVTRAEPYDNLNDGRVFFITTTVPANAKLLAAEVVMTGASNINLFVGRDNDNDGQPEGSEALCEQDSSDALEACYLSLPQAGTYWMVVQNAQSVTAAPTETRLAAAVVPATDAENLRATAPASVTQGQRYDLRLFWEEPEMEAGSYWYGAIDLGATPATAGNIGLIPVSIKRLADDVQKQVSPEIATPGATLSYTITVQPNVTPEDLTYLITDTLPAGLTYVANSARASSGTVTVSGSTLRWTGTVGSPQPRYTMETSLTDPTSCQMPLANQGAYLDLESAANIRATSAITGNNVVYQFQTTGQPPLLNFYGVNTGNRIFFSTDGFGFLGDTGFNAGQNPGMNMPIPTPAMPNNLLAVLWRDLRVVYNGTLNHGVSIVDLVNNQQVPVGHLVEYDNVQDANNPAIQYDFEFFLLRAPNNTPGEYEVVYAYNNLPTPLPITGTIGIENATGTAGVQYAYNNLNSTNLQNRMAVCFNYVAPTTNPITITYQARVNASVPYGTTITNTVTHQTNAVGSVPGTATATVRIEPRARILLPLIFKQRP